ncbi:MAG: TetR/AcrR family transcriptional regulator [Clostridia bacterium]|nr:TetR/AcrR family transcriptional regulator [Clostridia bacterium]
MPPKANLTKEKIAEKAFEILRSEGYDALNARYLAASLGVSTMPLFHYYENMDEIKIAAITLGVEKYCRYMEDGMGEEFPFKGIGKAYIKFAKEEPKLFKIFFMTADDKVIGVPKKDPKYGAAFDIASNIMNGNQDEGSRILKSMWIFVHGIASLEATGKTTFDEFEVNDMLSDVFWGLKNQLKSEEKNNE